MALKSGLDMERMPLIQLQNETASRSMLMLV